MTVRYESILVDTRDAVGYLTLDRPEVRNALDARLVRELLDALTRFDLDDAIGCIVLTGAGEAFAAGADIGEVAGITPTDMHLRDPFLALADVARLRTPIIAAVNGAALGGGCELAMMCDLVVAADTATFAQPEVRFGILPGTGGTQRLPRAIGAYKAADLLFTGRRMDAVEAERCGLVSRVVPAVSLMDAASAIAREIASQSRAVVRAIKEALRTAQDSGLTEGLRMERSAFLSVFALDARAEGMAAFREKRRPDFAGK